jgi:hydroxyacylglutathione hydrolase
MQNSSISTSMDTDLTIVGLPAFTDNYLWVLRHEGNAVAVDPGDAAPILKHLDSSGDRLTAILVTHHHPDHIGGINALRERFDVPVFGPQKENIAGVTTHLVGGETIEVPGLDMHFNVLDVGGHTLGHIAYYRPKVLFCGDALFVLGCGRLFEGTPAQMAQSLARIAALPRDTMVYCAHEYTHYNLPFALAVEPGNDMLQKRAITLQEAIKIKQPTVPMRLGDELDTNPFLRCDVAEVINAARNFRGHPLSASTNQVETFAALREWRNNV